jgi:hypothetical protein
LNTIIAATGESYGVFPILFFMVYMDVREFGQHPSSDNWTLSAYTHNDSERDDEMHTRFDLKEVELVQDVLSKAGVAFEGLAVQD